MKVWVTKYALSRGIFEVEGGTSIFSTMFCVSQKSGHTDYYHKPYWHETRESAVAHAEEMRVSKVAFLKKQVEKLEKLKLKFDGKVE